MNRTKTPKIKVIDIFSGPGGLAEGFSNCSKGSPFEIAVSVECEPNAHKTLTLRSFFRKLTTASQRKDYYKYIGSSTLQEQENNKKAMIENNQELWDKAHHETLGSPHALGNPEKWRKIKDGIPLTDKDEEDTIQEAEIFSRIDEIKRTNEGPLILIGGPPCQSYSVNGRNRLKAEKDYKVENDERFFLYQEYLKVIDAAQPDLFIMENVEGITSAKLATGELIFEKIKSELVRPDNKPKERYDIYSLAKIPSSNIKGQGPVYKSNKDYVIKASNYGVPQGRKRVILLGIKRAYGPINTAMEGTPSQNLPKMGELISRLPKLRSGMSEVEKESDTVIRWLENWEANKQQLLNILRDKDQINFGVDRLLNKHLKNTKNSYSSKELKKIKLKYKKKIEIGYSKTAEELIRLKQPIEAQSRTTGNDLFLKTKSATFKPSFAKNHSNLSKWLVRDNELQGVSNHQSRRHMKRDLQRYMFSACWAKAHKDRESPSPKSNDFPKALSPDHKNWESGHHADRFRAIEAEQIPLTITSHLRKDGHAQIHYDAVQNRSLTVREAARVQTFPDDYYFEGSQGWQFQQVGNAVPSYLAKQIALYVLKVMKDKKIVKP
ncbi:MAG: DNA (cytosine-5-)-methyltransferase [Porticoccaceae bacterium]